MFSLFKSREKSSYNWRKICQKIAELENWKFEEVDSAPFQSLSLDLSPSKKSFRFSNKEPYECHFSFEVKKGISKVVGFNNYNGQHAQEFFRYFPSPKALAETYFANSREMGLKAQNMSEISLVMAIEGKD